MPFLSMMPQQLENFRTMESEGTIVILYVIKFNRDGGREIFEQYEKNLMPLVNAKGGRVLYKGSFLNTMIGRGMWDRVMLVEYPSRSAYLELMGSDAFLHEDYLRIEAVEDMRMFCLQAD
ncbi:MAG: DUF1330 domain-containing protein [Candidatus Hydrogenedentes bacterium]|nr:DUF1330 domain-containing protein [Candidatus Hydrogenedentota bacterium]